MSGKKGMKHYPDSFRSEIIKEHEAGLSVHFLSRKYGISRYAIQSWCGLRSEVKIRQTAPMQKGRPRKYPITSEQDLMLENKRLKMENELLRSLS